ncbi:phage tail sheath subtilisin-like domain-containing protein [Algicola sagamiensis]|uniref:phage tail sheath subtilisin-like domain-containing protein n=1 Tax=Algicola sagamiensis TaxID=163869 RepID=UPI000377F6FB|nr:phage tail sheath subtilisin-like domain-containing protein [Algicola sagamiensis]
MPEQFQHGVEIVELDNAPRAIRTVKSSVIGIIGTAPDADKSKFPLNIPVLVAGSLKEAAKLGKTGTLPGAMDGIFDQTGAMVVVIRVDTDDDVAKQQALIQGGVDTDTGEYTGVHAFLSSAASCGAQPKLLIAPGFTDEQSIVTEMVGIAERLRAVVIADGPSTNDTDVIAYRNQFGSGRIFLVDPAVKVKDPQTGLETIQPLSPRVAGLIAKTDNKRGFWHSPSNQEINGIIGSERTIHFIQGDPNVRANLLNENEITTLIRKRGFFLWGNRTCSSDPKWAFLQVRRTADIIQESVQRALDWAVDRNITTLFTEMVEESVNAYLRNLINIGAILGGECWADPDLNTPANIAAGKAYFNIKFTPPTPAEHIVFHCSVTNEYMKGVVNG